MFKSSLLFSLYLILTPSVFAAVVVDSAALDASGVTINGNGFGGVNPMVFWDDVDANFANSNVADGANAPVGANQLWEEFPFGYPMKFVKAVTRSGKSKYVYYNTGSSGALGTPKTTGAISNILYVSWWYKPGISPAAFGASNKFIRVWDDSNGVGTRVSWTQMHSTCLNSTDPEILDWGDWTGIVNGWNHHEFFIDLNQQKIIAKVNGKTSHSMSCIKDANKANVPLHVQVLGFDNGDGTYGSQTTTLDDIYIGNSQARVVVSDSSVWGSDIKTEVLPIKTWTNTQVTAGVVDSSITINSQLYVYIIDDLGRANTNGVRLSCPRCPVMH
jgi:hypothetical protein